MMRSHTVASSTASVFYMRGGAYDRVNCTNSDQTLSDCEHGLIGGVNPRGQCSTGQFAQVECKGMPVSSVSMSMKSDIPLCILPPELTSAVLIYTHGNNYQTAFVVTTTPPDETTIPQAPDSTIPSPAGTTTDHEQATDSTTTSFEDPDSTSGAGTNPAQNTIGPGSVQPQSDPLLAIILGVVGGLISLLLLAIVLLLVIIAVRKKYTPQSSREDR